MSPETQWWIANASWAALALCFAVWGVNNAVAAVLNRRTRRRRGGAVPALWRLWRWSNDGLGAIAWCGLAVVFSDVVRRRIDRGLAVGDDPAGVALRFLIAVVITVLVLRWAFGWGEPAGEDTP